MTPLLLIFGYPAPVAIGTDLIYAALTKTGGAWSHHRAGNIDWRVLGLLASGSIPLSILMHSLILDQRFQDSPGFEKLLTGSLGVMLIITSIILIFKNMLRPVAIDNRPGLVMNLVYRNRAAMTIIMGSLLGVCVTLSSVGAGAFGAAILLVIYSQTPAVKIIGTDIAHAVPLTFIAGSGYLLAGYVDFTLLASLLIGSLPAIHLGSKLGDRVPEKRLQWILTSVLMLLGINYLLV